MTSSESEGEETGSSASGTGESSSVLSSNSQSGSGDRSSSSDKQSSDDEKSDSGGSSGKSSDQPEVAVSGGSEAPAESGSGGASSDESGSGDASSSSAEGDNASPASSPAPADDYIFETNEQHKNRHDFPSKVRNCNRCFFLHNERKWKEIAPWLHDTRSPEVRGNFWHVGCRVCQQHGGSGPFANCRASAKISNILRHAQCDSHQVALAKQTAEANNGKEDGEHGVEAFSSSPLAVGYSHIMFQRVLIKTGSSFLSFQDWLKTAHLAGADVPTGAFGREVSKQLTQAMALHELEVTQKLLEAASIAGAIQDAREDKVPVLLKMILGQWPRGLVRHEGKLPGGVTALGRHGSAPWVALRVAAVGSGSEKAQGLANAVAKASKDDSKLEENKLKVRFVATDGAFDALSYADAVLPELPNCRFHSEDESHSAMTILKHAMDADEEIAVTDALFVSSKKPYSLAKFLGTSTHFAKLFQKEQA